MSYVLKNNTVEFNNGEKYGAIDYPLMNRNQCPNKYDLEYSACGDRYKWTFYIPPKKLYKYSIVGLDKNNTRDITMPKNIRELKFLRLAHEHITVPKKVLILYIDSSIITTVQFKCSKNIRALTLSSRTNIPIQLPKGLIYLNFVSRYSISQKNLFCTKSKFSQKLDLPQKLRYLDLSDSQEENVILPNSLTVLIFNSSNHLIGDNIPCGLNTLIRNKYYAEPLINLPNTLKMYKICEKKYEIKHLYKEHTVCLVSIWC